jgi:hypothetical protein
LKGGTGPFGDDISMGGMFTIIKVRDQLESYDKDPGWYQPREAPSRSKPAAQSSAGMELTSMPGRRELSTARHGARYPGLAPDARPQIPRCLDIPIRNGANMKEHRG